MALFQVARNGTVDSNTSNVIFLLYWNHGVYYFDANSVWHQWSGSAWLIVPHDPRAVESAQGTQVTSTTGTIFDSNLAAWSLVQSTTVGLQVAHNYMADTTTANVSLLLYWSGNVYYENTSGGWFFWSGSAWTATVDPRTAPSQVPGAPTSLASPSHTGTTVILTWAPPTTGGVIDVGGYQILYKTSAAPSYSNGPNIPQITPGKGSIVSGGNTWTISPSGVIFINGTPDSITKGVLLLMLLPNGQFWQQNNLGDWYTASAPNIGWTGPTTTPLASGVPVISLSLDTTYNFEVRAYNSAGNGSVAGPISVRTNAVATTNFTVTGGKILDPNGNVFVSRGINVLDALIQNVTPTRIIQMFPRCNLVRLAVGSGNGYPSGFNQPNWDWTFMSNWISAAVSAGLVVVVDDHEQSSGSPGYTGQALTNDLNYAQQVGSTFANAPNVWIQNFNEPGFFSGLSQYHRQFYDAFRRGGSSSLVIHDVSGNAYNGSGAVGDDASVYRTMFNTGVDLHSYTNFTRGNTNQSQVNTQYNNVVQQCQAFAPISSNGSIAGNETMIGWWGECGWLNYNGDYNTDSQGGDGTNQVVYAALNSTVLQGGRSSGGAIWYLTSDGNYPGLSFPPYSGWPNQATGMTWADYSTYTEHGTYWNSIA